MLLFHWLLRKAKITVFTSEAIEIVFVYFQVNFFDVQLTVHLDRFL